MNLDELKELVETGREIEFIYDEKRFSITYGEVDGIDVISFCEFYQESTEVQDFDSLLKISRYGKTLSEMILSVDEEQIEIY